jgi:Ion channel
VEGYALPADMPLWRRHLDPDGYGYAWLLVLILVGIGFGLGAPDEPWARLVTLVVQSATLLAALQVSGAHPWLVRGASIAVVVAIVGTAGVFITAGEIGRFAGRTVGLMLVVLAPAAIIHGIVRQARTAGVMTVRTMFGVLCVYLLIGVGFGFAYGVISAADTDRFFAQMKGGDHADFLYFSFASLTTTGFGDLTAATPLGRSMAVTEALLGQVYLVTVVALIVSNMARPPRAGT